MNTFEQIHIVSKDGLRLEIRRHSGGEKTPIICIPGLTRNAADFEDISPILTQEGRDVVTITLRGRAGSDYDPNFRNYHPLVYRDDVLTTLDQLEIKQAIFIGTSLGGITTMLVNDIAGERVAAAILNDIGPDLAPEGLARIAGYVGQSKTKLATLDEAAAAIKAINEVAFPGRNDDFWRTFAKRTFREEENGWVLDYDPAIARGFTEGNPPPDLWPSFESLKKIPTLLIRGAISDLLSMAIVEDMRKVHPHFDYCEVPDTGHAPTLSEPVAVKAIANFLDKLD